MLVQERVAKPGFEPIYDLANQQLANVEAEVAAKIEAETAERKAILNDVIARTSEIVEREVPDPVEAPVEEGIVDPANNPVNA